jgi:hypothetical protein
MTQLRIVIFLLAQWQKYQECCSKRDVSSNERFLAHREEIHLEPLRSPLLTHRRSNTPKVKIWGNMSGKPNRTCI